MQKETKEGIIGRIERMKDRFSNAGHSIGEECDAAIEKIRSAPAIHEALFIESQLLIACNNKYPVDWADILSCINFYEQYYRHEEFLTLCGAEEQ
jgi:hypothetical protein